MMVSKSANIPKQITDGHDVMTNVLENRLMRLTAAQTFWKKEDLSQLITYLLRTNDDSVFVDIFPYLTEKMQKDEQVKQKKFTLGACLELLPILDRLLRKKYEVYICVSLDFIRTLIKRWYLELRDTGKQSQQKNFNNSMSLFPVYSKLISLTEIIGRLSLKKGNVGTKAKVVHDLLLQLQ